MKTVIDAVNYFKGKTTDDFIFESTIDHPILKKGMLVGGDTNPDSRMFIPVCTINQFYQCVREMSKAEWMKPVTSPIYTQDMVDNGGIVEAGMLFATEAGEYTAEYTNKKSIVFTDEDGFLISIIRRTAKPITPLIDGKAYQFDYKGATSIGICHTSEKNGTTHIMFETPIMSSKTNSEFCTNIKLLEVKS